MVTTVILAISFVSGILSMQFATPADCDVQAVNQFVEREVPGQTVEDLALTWQGYQEHCPAG